MQNLKKTITLFLCFFSGISIAEEQKNQEETKVNQSIEVERITVLGTGHESSSFELPGMVSTINMDQPALANSSSQKDIFKLQPWVEMQGSSRPNGQMPAIRGLSGSSISILIDGIPQTFQSKHNGSFFLDPIMTQSVEVIRGPYSALYGSGGLGGIIAFETLDPQYLLKGEEGMGFRLGTGYQTADENFNTSMVSYGAADKWTWLLGASYRRTQDIKLGGDKGKLASDHNIGSLLMKVGREIEEEQRVDVGFNYFKDNAIEPADPQDNDVASGRPGDQNRKKDVNSYQVYLNYELKPMKKDLVSFDLDMYYNVSGIDEIVGEDSTRHQIGDKLGRKLESAGFKLKNISTLNGKLAEHQISYGLDFHSETQDGKDSRYGQRAGVPHATANYLGLFLQEEMMMSSIMGDFLLLGSLRQDFYNSSLEDDTLSNNDQALSPKIGLSYFPMPFLNLFTNYSFGFRAPNLTELYANGIHFSIPCVPVPIIGCMPGTGGDNFFQPNPDLKPEKLVSWESGFGMDFSGLLQADDYLSWKSAFFITQGKDFIDYDVKIGISPCCGTTQLVNVNDAELSGWESEFLYDIGSFHLYAGYSYVVGKNMKDDSYLKASTPHKLTILLSYDMTENATVGWVSRFAGEHKKVSKPEEERPAYKVFDAYYQVALDNFNVNLGVDNIFDTYYQTVFANVAEMGRNYRIGMDYQF